tara:strand:+ start:686 stop:2488 length:1803 start_codon:yes stop_codon:yes gene_type:complete
MFAKPTPSNFTQQIQKDQITRANMLYQKSQAPFDTGVVNGFNPNLRQFSPLDDNTVEYSLTGERIDRSTFGHNNMTPFLKKNVTQNTNVERYANTLSNHTGRDPMVYQSKKETECFFKPTSGISNVCGMKNNDDFYKSRINELRSHNNAFPIQQIRVGPGINQGYSSSGIGGFQQANTSKYAVPTDLYATRPKSDQRSSTFAGRFQAPQKGIDRGLSKEAINMEKRLPEKTFEQTKDNLFTTTGAVIAPETRPEFVVQPTSRVDTHKEYKGIVDQQNVGRGDTDDYNKSAIIVYDNERQLTEERTVVSNVASIIPAVVAPLLDTAKNSIKEYLVDAPRTYAPGSMKAQMPEQLTTYDPVTHIAKTTIKETLIHDNTMNNLKGADANYTAPQDAPKTTMKETTNIKDTLRNIGGTTYKVYSYDPNLVAKTTTKETTTGAKNLLGYIGGFIETMFGGYLSSSPDAKNTQKQFTSDVEHTGGGDAKNKSQMSRDNAFNAEIDGTREAIMVSAGHTPNAGSGNLGKIGHSSSKVKMDSNRLVEDDIAPRERGNVGKIYQSSSRHMDHCEITHEKQSGDMNAFKDRLDPVNISSRTSNPFAININ